MASPLHPANLHMSAQFVSAIVLKSFQRNWFISRICQYEIWFRSILRSLYFFLIFHTIASEWLHRMCGKNLSSISRSIISVELAVDVFHKSIAPHRFSFIKFGLSFISMRHWASMRVTNLAMNWWTDHINCWADKFWRNFKCIAIIWREISSFQTNQLRIHARKQCM